MKAKRIPEYNSCYCYCYCLRYHAELPRPFVLVRPRMYARRTVMCETATFYSSEEHASEYSSVTRLSVALKFGIRVL